MKTERGPRGEEEILREGRIMDYMWLQSRKAAVLGEGGPNEKRTGIEEDSGRTEQITTCNDIMHEDVIVKSITLYFNLKNKTPSHGIIKDNTCVCNCKELYNKFLLI